MRTKFTTTIDSVILKEIKISAIEEGIPVSKFLENIYKTYLQTKKD